MVREESAVRLISASTAVAILSHQFDVIRATRSNKGKALTAIGLGARNGTHLQCEGAKNSVANRHYLTPLVKSNALIPVADNFVSHLLLFIAHHPSQLLRESRTHLFHLGFKLQVRTHGYKVINGIGTMRAQQFHNCQPDPTLTSQATRAGGLVWRVADPDFVVGDSLSLGLRTGSFPWSFVRLGRLDSRL